MNTSSTMMVGMNSTNAANGVNVKDARSRLMALKWLNVVGYAAMIGVNAAANIVPIGGNTTAEVSAAYPTLFTPAPVTFFIWAIIYVLMGVFVVAQFLPKRGGMTNVRTRSGSNGSEWAHDVSGVASVKSSLVDQVGPWFIVSCVLNISWMLTWHFQLLTLSLVLIFALLVSLLFINFRVNIDEADSVLGKVAIGGFQVYLGWITAATIANASVLLVSTGWDGFGFSATFWTVLVLVVGGVLGALFSVTQDWVFSTMAVMWAYAGILVRHISETGFGLQYPTIIVTLILLLIVLFVVIMVVSSPQFEADEYAWGF